MQTPSINKTEIVHQNPWYRVRRDELTWPNDKPGQYFVTEIPDCAITICLKEEKILMDTLFRYAIQQESLEFPGGACEANEDPLSAAKRELQEETGYVAKDWEQLGTVFGTVGAAHAKVSIFLAQDLTFTHLEQDQGEQNAGFQTLWISENEVRQAIKEGRIVSEEALTTWALYREWKDARTS